MIAIIVDTNILRESPYLSRSEWTSLSDHKTDWEVSLLIPDIVLMETTKVVTREWDKQRESLSSAKVGTFGLQDDLDSLLQRIQDHIDNYEEKFRSLLSELGAEVVPCPEVPHMEIASRASRGTAPYHAGDKDGYRDTLIWFTVLDVAAAKPQHEVWFVSNNTNDFGDPSVKKKADDNTDAPQLPRPLHPDLEQDLESRGLKGRVRYATSLRTLEQHIASLHGPIAADSLEELTSLLDFDALQAFLNSHMAIDITPEDAALTPGTEEAIITKLSTSDHEWTFSDAAGRGEDRWTANYLVDAEAEIFTTTGMLTKILRVSGTAAFTKQGQPEEVQIARIEALPDDPNRGLWAVLGASGFGQLDLTGVANPASSSFLQAVRAHGLVFSPESLKNFNEAMKTAASFSVAPETLKNFNQAMKTAASFSFTPEALENFNQAMKTAASFSVAPETLKNFNQALKAAHNPGPDEPPTDGPVTDDGTTASDDDQSEEGDGESAS